MTEDDERRVWIADTEIEADYARIQPPWDRRPTNPADEDIRRAREISHEAAHLACGRGWRADPEDHSVRPTRGTMTD